MIGGTGLYQMDELQVTGVREVTAPFGPPSSPIVVGVLQGRNIAFLARHGLHHDLLPSEINYRGAAGSDLFRPRGGGPRFNGESRLRQYIGARGQCGPGAGADPPRRRDSAQS